MADEIMQHLKKAKTRSLSFDRHVHFTNLSSVSVNAITYINILRDPIEKLTSRYVIHNNLLNLNPYFLSKLYFRR